MKSIECLLETMDIKNSMLSFEKKIKTLEKTEETNVLFEILCVIDEILLVTSRIGSSIIELIGEEELRKERERIKKFLITDNVEEYLEKIEKVKRMVE